MKVECRGYIGVLFDATANIYDYPAVPVRKEGWSL